MLKNNILYQAKSGLRLAIAAVYKTTASSC
jgi:hypothetical protein